MREPVDTRIAFLGLGVRELQPYNMDYKGMCVNLYGEEYFFWNTRVTTMHLNFICSRAVRASERERSLRSFVRSFLPSFVRCFHWVGLRHRRAASRIENENETRVLVVLIFKAQARARKGGARSRCRS